MIKFQEMQFKNNQPIPHSRLWCKLYKCNSREEFLDNLCDWMDALRKDGINPSLSGLASYASTKIPNLSWYDFGGPHQYITSFMDQLIQKDTKDIRAGKKRYIKILSNNYTNLNVRLLCDIER